MYSLLSALILVACVFAKDDHARVFGPGKDFGSFEESGTLSSTSSTSSSSTSSSSSSDEDRSRRAERDQRRIELAVQDALLADNPEPAFPQRAQFKSKSYQITYTTVKDSLPDERIGEARSNPVFGPVAIVSYTAPLDGMWGPERTRAQIIGLDNRNNFGVLFQEVRKAGFLGEFELRTLVQTDLTFNLRSPALVTPCFPVTDEPGLTIEVLVLLQNYNAQIRKKWLAIDRFFDDNHDFIDEFCEELGLSRYIPEENRFEESQAQDTVIATVAPCQQYSYFQ